MTENDFAAALAEFKPAFGVDDQSFDLILKK